MSMDQIKPFVVSAVLAVGLTLLGSGCDATQQLAAAQSTQSQAQASTSPTGIAVAVASAAQCANGGSLIESYSDANGNGKLDLGETVLSISVICDGANGAAGVQGVGAGISITPSPSGSCPAGGDSITTFTDSNNNGALDAGETVTSTSTLCNGANGSNGSSAHLTISQATQAQCPSGGTSYSSYIDGESPVVTAVCNGANGTQIEMGALGPQVPNEPFSACHHDYIYIPGTSTAKGWLVFRHQANGASDQGIGSTGFQVWNVDISDFALISEVGSVTYCQVHWDPSLLTLSYTVVDSDDGFQGQTGTVKF